MSKKAKFITEIRKKDQKSLEAEIAKRYRDLRTARFEIGFGTFTNLKKLRTARKELAQLWTVLGEKMIKEQDNGK
jgi:ribosomal protein L29